MSGSRTERFPVPLPATPRATRSANSQSIKVVSVIGIHGSDGGWGERLARSHRVASDRDVHASLGGNLMTPLFRGPRRLLLPALFSVLALLCLSAPASATTVTVPFSYTGAPQSWTVPAGVTSATFDLYGAQGGVHFGTTANLGGQATAVIPVTP